MVGYAAAEVGASSLTATGAIFGTPDYMAPEQALGRPATPQTDLYAMGVILFEMLSGTVPFRGVDARSTIKLHVKMPAPTLSALARAPWCTPVLDELIARALQKQPRDRFRDAAEMLQALDAAERAIAPG